MSDTESAGTLETRKDAGEGGGGTFKLWEMALSLASKHEATWRKQASKTIERYRDETKGDGENPNKGFNILYSSVQTQSAAIYNSTPSPDVRRRFNDKDPVGKIAAQAFERTLSHCMDEYDFSAMMKAVVHDSQLPGRGLAIVEYEPTVEGGEVAYETARGRHVQWDDFRHGPGKVWEDVPWIAIRYRITREAAIKLNPKAGPTVTLDYMEKNADKDSKDVPDVFKRLTVWKIWDKAARKIVFHAPSYKSDAFAVVDDKLKLKDFFPMPRPFYDVEDSSSLIPIIPFEMYRTQAEELDRITRRIHSLINVLKWRGIRPANIEELDRLRDAEDGELIPSESWATLAMMQGGNPDKAIWLMPIERLILVIRELVVQREAVKQTIFEITGLSDILRGDTNPNETLGAQQIKAQWGSMRMQSRQAEAQRFARDLLRIKAEIIGEHFSVETLQMMTGIQLPTPEQKAQAQQAIQQATQTQQQPPPEAVQAVQSPTWEDVQQIMASDALRSFRVDIETDSTIQADLGRAQQNMANFVQGLASFGQAMVPAVESGVIPREAVTAILTGFARNFKLGKQAEDALDQLGEEAPKPDPRAAQEQATQQREDQKVQAENALATQTAQQNAQSSERDNARKDAEFQHKQQTDNRTAEREDAKFNIEAQRSQAETLKVKAEASPLADADDKLNEVTASLDRAADALNDTVAQLVAAAEDINRDREIVRDGQGKAVGLRVVN